MSEEKDGISALQENLDAQADYRLKSEVNKIIDLLNHSPLMQRLEYNLRYQTSEKFVTLHIPTLLNELSDQLIEKNREPFRRAEAEQFLLTVHEYEQQRDNPQEDLPFD